MLWWHCCGGAVVLLWRSPPRGYKQATALYTNTSHHTALTDWLLKCDGKTLPLHASTLFIYCLVLGLVLHEQLEIIPSYCQAVRHQKMVLVFTFAKYVVASNHCDKDFGKYFEVQIQILLISTRYFHGTLLLLSFQSF